jgi:regulatory protein
MPPAKTVSKTAASLSADRPQAIEDQTRSNRTAEVGSMRAGIGANHMVPIPDSGYVHNAGRDPKAHYGALIAMSERHSAAPGGELTPDLIEGWALHYLERFASSAQNLRRVLLRRAFRRGARDAERQRAAAALIDALIARYCAAGLIDDAAYAAGRVESLRRRGYSQQAIRARLAQKGVAAALAAQALAAAAPESDPDLAAACAFARRRRLGPYRRGPVDRERELKAFARAGFARSVAEAVLACADEEAAAALARGGRG